MSDHECACVMIVCVPWDGGECHCMCVCVCVCVCVLAYVRICVKLACTCMMVELDNYVVRYLKPFLVMNTYIWELFNTHSMITNQQCICGRMSEEPM